MADPKIKYDIEAVVSGQASVQQMATAIDGLGNELDGDLKVKALAAAAALQSLAAKQDAVTNFRELTNATGALAIELAEVRTASDQAEAQLASAAAATRTLAQAEQAARTAAAGARADYDEMRQALRTLREEYTGSARQTDAYKEASAQLRVTVKDLKDNLRQANTEVQTSAQAAKAAQTAEKALAAEYANAAAAARAVGTEVQSQNRALENARTVLQSVGISTENLSQAEANLKTAVAAARAEVQTMAPAYQAAAAAASSAAATQVQAQRSVRDGVNDISASLQKIQNLASIALGGSIIGGLLKGVTETADAYKNLSARIQLATGDTAGFKTTFAGVAEVALRTNSELEGTGVLFGKITQAGKEAGLSSANAQLQALALTETINQAIQLSGTSADAAKAGLTQLIQGLQSGVLRGDEFNSVMENSPRLAQALAQGLGVTTGELRKMAEQGALTSNTVIRALTNQSDVVASEFGKLPLTVGRALQNVSTQWTLYVGEADKGGASSANVAKVIQALGNNIDLLVSSLYAAGKAFAAIKIAALAGDVLRWATATTTATVATQASTAATVADTAAKTANAVATRAAGTASTFAATQAAAAASSVQSAGIVWRGFTGLLGPVGIAAAALAPEIVGLARSAGEGIASWTGWGKVLTENEGKLKLQDAALRANAEAMVRQAALAEEVRNKQFELSKTAVNLVGQFDELRKKGDSASEAIGKIGRDFDLSNVAGVKNAGAVLDKLLADGKLTAAEFQEAWARALDGKDLAKFQILAQAAFTGSSREAERLAQVLDAGVRAAVQRTGLDFDVLKGGIGAAARSAINDFTLLAANVDKLKASGVDASLVLSQSLSKAIDTADSQKAIDALRGSINGLKTVTGTSASDEIARGLLGQLDAKAEELKLKFDELKGGINSSGEAMKFFGLKSAEALTRAATESKTAYDVLRNSGKGTADQLREAFIRTANDAIAANKGIVPSWLEGEAAVRGVKITVDAFGKACVEAAGAGGQAFDNFGGHVRGTTADIEAQIAALDKINAKYGQSQADRAGKYSTPDGKSIVGATREDRLAGQNAVDNTLVYSVRDKLSAGTLGAGDLANVQAVIAQLQQNDAINRSLNSINPGGISVQGMQSAQEMEVLRRRLQEAAQQLSQPATVAKKAAASPASSPAPAPVSASNKTITVNLSGRSTTFNVASAQDQETVTALFRQLEADMART